jgi:hypothetical protein
LVKLLVAVGGNFGLFTSYLNRTNPMQDTVSRWPEFYLVEDIKEFGPFPIKSLFHLLFLWSFQDMTPILNLCNIVAESPGVAPGCMDLESM